MDSVGSNPHTQSMQLSETREVLGSICPQRFFSSFAAPMFFDLLRHSASRDVRLNDSLSLAALLAACRKRSICDMLHAGVPGVNDSFALVSLHAADQCGLIGLQWRRFLIYIQTPDDLQLTTLCKYRVFW